MQFELQSELSEVETIAASGSIRELRRLQKKYGFGRWRKLKGTALTKLPDGAIVRAEIHWYEAHGIGRRELKIKQILD